MPFKRSNNNSRNNSRSPVPPPGFSAPRPFLPPSHYAAAGGLDYFPRTSPQETKSQPDSVPPQSSAVYKHTTDSKKHNRNSLVPISYPPEFSDTSSFEIVPAEDAVSSTLSSNRSSHDSRGKRQSHMQSVPLLETQLLPSLRDTIDRMTRPPSQCLYNPPSSGPAHPALQNQRGRSPSPSVSSVTSTATYTSVPALSSRHPKSAPSTPRPSPMARQGALMPTESSSSKTKPKSALKSALRAPTPKLSSGKNAGTDSPSFSPGASLRSVRSILGRKSSTTSTLKDNRKGADVVTSSGNTTAKNHKQDRSSPTPTTQNGRARSRTDPGAPPKTSTTSRSAQPTTPQPHSNNNQKFVSSLPRRTDFSRKPSQSDDSDIEYKYDMMNGRGARKLIVTNAEIRVSSSSESEAEAMTPDRNTRLPMLSDRWAQSPTRQSGNLKERQQHQQQPVIGLGMRFEGVRRSREEESEDNIRIRRKDELSYTDDHNSRGYSTPVERAGHPTYQTNDHLNDDHRRKRNAALMGIVNDLDMEQGFEPRLEDREMGGNFQNEFVPEEIGMAYGNHIMDLEYDEASVYGSESEEEPNQQFDDWREQDREEHSRPRSVQRTPMPTLVVSMEDDRRGGRRSSQVSPDPRLSANFSSPKLRSTPTLASPRSDHRRPAGEIDERNKGRKSPSRSPVIRQTDPPSVPPVLQRHSVYLSPSSPDRTPLSKPQSEFSPTHDSDRFDRWAEQGQSFTREQDRPDYEGIRIVQNSYAAAARDRQAFGIPPSESEEVHRQAQRLSHAGSEMSSVGEDTMWQDDCDELSVGAEALFRKISGGQAKENNRRSCYGSGDDSLQSNPDEEALYPRRRSFHESRSRTQFSENNRASSVYDNTLPQHTHQTKEYVPDQPSEAKTWRSDLPSAAYAALLGRHGEAEMQRQEVIWQLCETEETFVNRLNTVLRLFIIPLRVQNSKTWISGVPTEVARFFDWLEDIANLHSQILSVLQTTRAGQYPVVERIAESLRPFVPRLEVYQPYLVRLVDVASTIGRLMQDSESDFGAFVQIQESTQDCEGWNLERYLVEPVNRLARYPDLIRQLHDLTPRDHPDYLSTFSLLHSTDTVIRIMTEVKIREDEYDLIKDIVTRLEGLPPTAQLARRERRLLAQGTLNLVESKVGTREHSRRDNLSVPTSQTDDHNASKRTSRLVEAINEWDVRRARSGSVKSVASSGTGVSFRSYETGTSTSPYQPPLPSSGYFASRSPHQSQNKYSPLHNDQMLDSGPLQLQVFVFTDLILLATPISKRKSNERHDWCLLDKIGLARILGFRESSEDSTESSKSVILDLLPIDVKDMEPGVIPETSSVTTMSLAFPTTDANQSKRQTWLSALQQCYQFTLRSLSFPSHSGAYVVYSPNLDLESDTQQSVLSILASGLPLPKSPSVQMDDVRYGHASDPRGQEREERGWWSLRFQQVLREVQRQEKPFSPRT